MHGLGRTAIGLGVFLVAGSLVAGEAPAADQVKVTGGVVEGTVGTDPSVRVFRGVPFAAPPVGELRWKEPQPVVPWEGVRQADTWGTRCMQGPMFGPLHSREKEMGEDCLYLNVWTTAASPDAGQPVLVVFHGGGFAAGSGSEPRTDGEWFAKQGIVVVEPNYRLGVFGFLAHPELSAESNGHGSGNYGLLDQAAAMRWVKENVAAFGGNPDDVTVNGESAGSLSVSGLMVSPLTKDMVKKAIGESGSFFPSPTGDLAAKPLAEKEQDGEKLAASLGKANLAELRAIPADELLAAVMKQNRGWGYWPGVDGYFFPKPVAELYAEGQQVKVPLLAGWNSSEMGMAVAMNPNKPTPESFTEQVKKQFGDHADAVLAVYPATDDDQLPQTAADLASDVFISYSTWKWIEVQAKAGAPVYRYRFDRVLPEANGSNRYGAPHAVEIEYAFNTLDSKTADWQSEDRETARTMATYFANFVKTGDPNGKGVPEWPQFGATGQVMYLDAVSQAGPQQHRKRYEALDKTAGR
jgi:para-nitrobenzyl esterase